MGLSSRVGPNTAWQSEQVTWRQESSVPEIPYGPSMHIKELVHAGEWAQNYRDQRRVQ